LNKPIHICCAGQPDEESYIKVSCNQEFNKTVFDDVPYVLLNIHLDWENAVLSNDSGFDIATLLRLQHKFLGLILFYSPLPYKEFLNKSLTNYKYKLLFGRGSKYLETPTTQKIINKTVDNIIPLTKAVLQDVSTMLCNLKGIVVDKIRHDLKKPSDASQVIKLACNYLNESQILDIKMEYYLLEFEKKDCDFDDLKEEFIERCERHLSLVKVLENKTTSFKYTIMVIDDEKSVTETVQMNLGKKFKILPFQDGIKALEVLKADSLNEIVAVIADWRLYEINRPEQWQSIQGYEILSYASRSGLRALFALTSQSEFIVHKIRNVLEINFHLFKKSDLHEKSGWSVISDILQEECNEISEILINIPSGKGWRTLRGKQIKESFQQLYYRLLTSANKSTVFAEIDLISLEIWNYLNEVYKTGNQFTDVLIIPVKFGLTLSTTQPKVEPALVQRRIWYGLWEFHPQKHQLDNTELFDDIHRIIYRSGQRAFDKNKKSQDPNKIGITINDLSQDRMFPEERSWLNNTYDLG